MPAEGPHNLSVEKGLCRVEVVGSEGTPVTQHLRLLVETKLRVLTSFL